MDCASGVVLGGLYRLEGLLGRGGHGTVWLARQIRTDRPAAVKELQGQALIMETALLKKLSHPGLPAIMDILEEDGRRYLVMEYVEGETLSAYLGSHGPVSEEQAADWGIQLCRVLSYLHERRPPVIHRDLKPSNLILRPDGRLVLIDFGTARERKEDQTGDTVWLGTRGYAAPEQYGGRGQTGPETDIYGLGMVLYDALGGMKGQGKEGRELSAGLERILQTCTRVEPKRRFSSCRILEEELLAFRTQTGHQRIWRMRLRSGCLILAAASLILAGSSLGLALAGRSRQGVFYESLLLEAEGCVSEEEAEALCEQAILLEPQRPEAYEQLLEIYVETDGSFSVSEERQFQELLRSESGLGTVWSRLQRGGAACGRAAYRIGLAYFYEYEGAGGRGASAVWFRLAEENNAHLTEGETLRTRLLGRIASYWDGLGKEKKSGDPQVSYADYWKDLEELSRLELEQKDNRITALVAARELAGRLADCGSLFYRDGIGTGQMEQALEQVETQAAVWEGQIESTCERQLFEEVKTAESLAEQTLKGLKQKEKGEQGWSRE